MQCSDLGDKPKRIRQDVVEVDVDAIDIPHGKSSFSLFYSKFDRFWRI